MNKAIERLRKKQATRAIKSLATGRPLGRRDLFPIDSESSLDADHWQKSMLVQLASMGVVTKIGAGPKMQYQATEGFNESKLTADLSEMITQTTTTKAQHSFAADFLGALSAHGIQLELAGDQIKFRAKSDALQPQLRAMLRDKKADLIALMKVGADDTIDPEVVRSAQEIAKEIGADLSWHQEDDEQDEPGDDESVDDEPAAVSKSNGHTAASPDMVQEETLKLAYAAVENCIYMREQNDKILKGIESLLTEWKIAIPWK